MRRYAKSGQSVLSVVPGGGVSGGLPGSYKLQPIAGAAFRVRVRDDIGHNGDAVRAWLRTRRARVRA